MFGDASVLGLVIAAAAAAAVLDCCYASNWGNWPHLCSHFLH